MKNMFEAKTFDELNILVKNKRSTPFEQYFGEMELTEEQKEKRISLAEKMKDEFLEVMAFMFFMVQYQAINWNLAEEKFQKGYLNALKGTVDIDDYTRLYIQRLSGDMIQSTKRHIDEPYYFSKDRAMVYAEEESNTIWNNQEFWDAVKSGKTRKKWVDIRDNRERKTHRVVGGTVLPIMGVFHVGNSQMFFPKDCSLYADVGEIANCRCTIKYF